MATLLSPILHSVEIEAFLPRMAFTVRFCSVPRGSSPLKYLCRPATLYRSPSYPCLGTGNPRDTHWPALSFWICLLSQSWGLYKATLREPTGLWINQCVRHVLEWGFQWWIKDIELPA